MSLGAFADSITVGTLTFLGYNSQGLSEFQMSFISTAGITAEPLNFEVAILVNGGSADDHFVTTSEPVTFLEMGGPATGLPPCPCGSLGVLLFFDNAYDDPFTFLLANGEPFKAYHQNISTMLPLPGQDFIQIKQSAPITITSVPEPATLLLFAVGLTPIAWCTFRERGGFRSHAAQSNSAGDWEAFAVDQSATERVGA
jgi:hypothetical protein